MLSMRDVLGEKHFRRVWLGGALRLAVTIGGILRLRFGGADFSLQRRL
jgi:hypothetical protein